VKASKSQAASTAARRDRTWVVVAAVPLTSAPSQEKEPGRWNRDCLSRLVAAELASEGHVTTADTAVMRERRARTEGSV
jgi:hypothetical protein